MNFSAARGHLQVVKLLLDKGARKNVKDSQLNTPLLVDLDLFVCLFVSFVLDANMMFTTAPILFMCVHVCVCMCVCAGMWLVRGSAKMCALS